MFLVQAPEPEDTMTQIVVAPERLEAVARTFADKRTETENIVNALRSVMEALDADWDGVAQNKFYSEWHEILPGLTQFINLLGEISSELRRIAQVFRETDESVI
jgi:WXG100 family type VII secretion target